MDYKIGIIGQGYVGTAINNGLSLKFKVNTYDKYISEKSTHNDLESLVDDSNLIFICLPTPMNKDGSCHTKIIEKVLAEIAQMNIVEKDKIFIIKSTVPPWTTESFDEMFEDLNFVYNPEFLREATSSKDFMAQKFGILGGHMEHCLIVRDMYREVLPQTDFYMTDWNTAEMVKNLINTFLATKVSFANEMNNLCSVLQINYDEVIKLATLDERLGHSHWQVPGPDGKLGFGGSCFPKDISSMNHLANQLGITCNVVHSAIETNLECRPEKDWEELKGRAVVMDEK